ncbi:MAG: protein translocase subunit SecF [candidate division WOR-3 bacterium]|nr:protein translocase subunit SecF [candidate division WOR-3 bacterium]MDW8150335.1 protein translocase subunit SecF [candidate division WOR-3 bacterium]
MKWIDIFANANYDFMNKRKIFYFIYTFLSILFIAIILFRGINFGIDFTGGNLIQVSTQKADISEVRSALKEINLKDVSVQNFGQEKEFIVRYSSDEDANFVVKRLSEILKENVELKRAEKVGPTIGAELRKQAYILSIIAIILILVYIWIRFDLYFGIGTIIALIVDLILVLGLYSIFQIEFNTITVAAILTILGYDVNDSVIIADRIREYLKKYEGIKLEKAKLIEIYNKGINSTLSRTIITSLSTLVVVVALLLFGGPVLYGFSFILFWGIIFGTMSSIFIVSASALDLKTRHQK